MICRTRDAFANTRRHLWGSVAEGTTHYRTGPDNASLSLPGCYRPKYIKCLYMCDVGMIPLLKVLQTKLVEYGEDRLAADRIHDVQRELRYCLVTATQLKSSGSIV